ncbi:MAG: Vacuolar protein sorting-associated protein 41 [Candelina submexicana]|nr:MAG: Vacuolar protein sorting-associated protein 41 [Candelina submexicana]
MAVDAEETSQEERVGNNSLLDSHSGISSDGAEDGEDGAEEEEDEEDEPKLKYARLTSHLGGIYRNGDATSTFLVAGDKMAHKASVTAISVSPFPPPLPSGKPDAVNKLASQSQHPPTKASSVASAGSPSSRSPRQQAFTATPSNSIHIATASIDGNVCVYSLIDPKDVMLRNFARPVQAVALSPEFKNDKAYLSGGLAGNLILTVGGRSGTSTTATTTGAAASASGWLGSIGLGSNTGKDTVLHSGEGAIKTINWSLSGKYVVWINEQGFKIMRSSLHLDSADTESAWKRISHVDRPDGPGWEEMAGVWRGRAEWIDENHLESDKAFSININSFQETANVGSRPRGTQINGPKGAKVRRVEKLVVGWGGTVWIINVHPGGAGAAKNAGERGLGRAEIVNILRTDCIISGLSLYTPSVLVVLAYVTPEESDEDQTSPYNARSQTTEGTPRRGRHHRSNALSPELRLIDITTSEEISTPDTLSVSRFEGLSATDYHLSVLPAYRGGSSGASQRGALEAFGGGLWDVTMNPTRLFSSGASVQSGDSNSGNSAGLKTSSRLSFSKAATPERNRSGPHPATVGPNAKIYIHSPYDCILATVRDLSDHLSWLLERNKYKEAWTVVDEHPEVISSSHERLFDSSPSTPTKAQGSLSDFFADDSSQPTTSASKTLNSAVEKEKRRIGEHWVQQLVDEGDWASAGRVCGQVLGTSSRWEHWVWLFVQSDKFEEITPFIPTAELQPPLPSLVYEVVLGHYIAYDTVRLKELLERWPPELYNIRSITTALEDRLRAPDVREDTIQGGEKGRDWRILMEGLAKLYLADGRPREALRCFIALKDADAAMNLIRDYRLLDAVSDDIPGLLLLRVSKEQMRIAPISELEQATSEPIKLLVDDAYHGIVRPEVVVAQLEENHLLFLFFYLRALWTGLSPSEETKSNDRLAVEGKTLVEDFGDLAVELFAEYDRSLLMDFLKSSQSYSFEKAKAVCERRNFVTELVYILSKTGETKRALSLIIDKLQDVSQAISFAKSQDDPGLWDDLLDYSMNKPRFIRGLLEEVGTAINPITLVRRIPEGLEIEGLRAGLSRMIKEYEIQSSISEGVARVLRGEVAIGMDTLRTRQKKGVKFNLVHDIETTVPIDQPNGDLSVKIPTIANNNASEDHKPGYCAGCRKHFRESEQETLVGFACGHVFHLTHLLKYENRDHDANEVQANAAFDGDADLALSVGAKVAHARLIRSRIADGCPIVHEKEIL